MARSPMPINFTNADHRDKWIADNADYFTVIRRVRLKNNRTEHTTQADAEAACLEILQKDPEARLLIYAVAQGMSAYVKSMTKKDWAKHVGRS